MCKSRTPSEVLPARGNTIGRHPVRRRSALAAGQLVRTSFSSDCRPNGDAELFSLCVVPRAEFGPSSGGPLQSTRVGG